MCKHLRLLALGAALISSTLASFAQSWTPLSTQPSFGAGVSLLLPDGSVMVHNVDTPHWWKLTPDSNGSYINGSWTQLRDMDLGYGPRFFASAVLKDGRVFVTGGEYNFVNEIWNNHGEVYDPATDTWTVLTPPTGWSQIGDAQCVIFPNGNLMMANPFDGETAILDPSTLTWSLTGATGKGDRNDEEGWTLLPDGTVLTVDALNSPATEKYIPFDNDWVTAGSTPNGLEDPGSQELGPMLLLPNGTVFAMGATQYTAIYTPPATPTDPGSWAAGPDFPLNGSSQQLDIADGPACVLPNGNVLCAASPGVFNAPTQFLEYNGGWITEPNTPNAGGLPSWRFNMLLLPNGQVLCTDFTSDAEIYTPVGGPSDSWRPTISGAIGGVVPGEDDFIQGTQFNGLTQANAYGDDSTNATNYPLVRIRNNGTGHVFYCRTHDHSTMAVATGGATVSSHYVVPLGTEIGESTIEVVANGIPSAAQDIYVDTARPVANAGTNQTVEATGPSTSFTLDGTASHDPDGDAISSYQWFDVTDTLVGSGSTLTLSRGLGHYHFILEVTDSHGLTASDQVDITVDDTTPPAFGTIPDVFVTATNTLGDTATFPSPVAHDLVDGDITGTCVPISGSTFAPGSTTVNVSATDLSGNTGHASFHVFVTYSWSGFLTPIPHSTNKAGSTIPIKFRLTGASSGITNLVATGSFALLTGGVPGPYTSIGTFSYDPLTGQYTLSWKTPKTPLGNYRIKADFGDGVPRTIDIVLR